jgi:hypothetical protein
MRLLVFVLCLAGCAGDGRHLDPTGRWVINVHWSEGDCGLLGGTSHLWDVTGAEGSYAVMDIDGDQVLGSPVCSSDHCDFEAQEASSLLDPPGSMDLTYVLTLDAADVISGFGSATLRPEGGSACTQGFSVTGAHHANPRDHVSGTA